MKEHPLAHILRAIADGKVVQYETRKRGVWADFDPDIHDFPANAVTVGLNWRVKPKPKVKKWRWVCEDSKKYMTVTTKHYSSAKEFNESFPGVKAVQRIDSTMIEVEKDDNE